MLNHRRATLNLEINNYKVSGNVNKNFVNVSNRYESTLRGSKTRRKINNNTAAFFRQNESTLDSDKLNSNRSFEKGSNHRKNSQTFFNFSGVSSIMESHSDDNQKLLNNISPKPLLQNPP